MKNNFAFFNSRPQRAQFIAGKFKAYIQDSSSILDVGCSDNEFKKIVGKRVFGVDISGNPDQKIDLEEEMLSSFESNSFDLIVCTEVLEHIDNFHETLDDIMRVANKYVLISLPNGPDIWKVLRILLFSETGKFYGLPLEKPQDRHKWFFSWKEADTFFTSYCKKNNLAKKEAFAHFNYSDSFKGFLLRTFLKIFPFRLFAQSYWILIEKK